MAFEPTIYTFGAGQYLNSIFQSMSILFDFSKNNMMVALYRLGAIIGVVMIVLKSFSARGSDGTAGAIDWGYFVRLFFVMFVIIVPKTTVHIEDVIKKQNYTVTGAPWSLAIFGWLTSSIGMSITEIYEDSLGGGMNPINQYANNGMAFGSQYYNNLPKVAKFGANDFDNILDPFINECYLPALTKHNSTYSGVTMTDMITGNSFYNQLQGMNTAYLQNRYVLVPNGGSKTCEQLRNDLFGVWPKAAQNILKFGGITNASGAGDENAVTQIDNDFIKSATDANATSLRQAMFINALYDASRVGAVRYNNTALADAFYQAQGQMQQASAWRQGSQFASMSIFWLHIVVECMIYSLWTFLTFLFIFPQGWTVLGEYLKMMMWIQMFPILSSILNSIIAVYATSKSQALAMQYGGYTTANFYTIGDLNSGIVTTVGYLSTMIPVIAWMFTSKLGGTIAAAGSFAGSFMNTAESVGKQEALGNMDINRVSVQSTNFAGSRTDGLRVDSHVMEGGTSTTVGNNTTIQSSAMNNKLTSSIDYNKAYNSAISESKSTIESELGSQSKAWAKQAQSSHTASLNKSGGSGTSSGDGYKDASVLSTYDKLQADVAANAEIAAKGGFELFGNGFNTKMGVSGKMSSAAGSDYQNSLNKLNDFQNKHSAELKGALGDSFTDTQGLTQQSIKTVSSAISTQAAISKNNSTGYSIKTSGDQAVLNSLYADGYKAKGLLDMQQTNPGQFANLMQKGAENWIKSGMQDSTDYSVKAPDFDATRQAINNKANTYQNKGNIDHVTGGANDAITKAEQANTEAQSIITNKYNASEESHDNDPAGAIIHAGGTAASRGANAVTGNAVGKLIKGGKKAITTAQNNAVKQVNKNPPTKIAPHGYPSNKK